MDAITTVLTVEPTKSDSWRRLTPQDSSVIGPIPVRSEGVPEPGTRLLVTIEEADEAKLEAVA